MRIDWDMVIASLVTILIFAMVLGTILYGINMNLQHELEMANIKCEALNAKTH